MGAIVKVLDRTGWSDEALDRADKYAEELRAFVAFKAAKAGHPLAGVLEGVTDASLVISEEVRHRLKLVDWGNGHFEGTIARRHPKLDQTLDRAIERDVSVLTPRGDGHREKNIERAARRAKQQVRYLAKSMMVNSLWTLTYRDNLTDREVVLKHLDAFRRRVVAVLGEWRYIACIESQERGALHIHLATHSLPRRLAQGGALVKSWDVMRSIWRSVVGEYGGNFDEAKRRVWGSKAKTKVIIGCGAIASYIAGYVAKDMLQSELNRKRYSASKNVTPPVIECEEFGADKSMHELVELLYRFVGDRITRSWFDKERGVLFVESDDSRPPG